MLSPPISRTFGAGLNPLPPNNAIRWVSSPVVTSRKAASVPVDSCSLAFTTSILPRSAGSGMTKAVPPT